MRFLIAVHPVIYLNIRLVLYSRVSYLVQVLQGPCPCHCVQARHRSGEGRASGSRLDSSTRSTTTPTLATSTSRQ